jgi:hypothetical protein
MMLDGRFHHEQSRQVDDGAADMVAVFLAAWEESIISYERLLDGGIVRDDAGLARDMNYARLLKAGRTICWIGGTSAVRSAARLIGRQIPSGDVQHFDRLWAGLMPDDQS